MGKFQNQIYKYIKHSHSSRWKDFEFNTSHKVFEHGTILLVVYFIQKYTNSSKKKILSEYYHSDQVFIFLHVLYIHVQVNVYGVDNTPESCNVIKEYHFYISDDHEHDTLLIQH